MTGLGAGVRCYVYGFVHSGAAAAGGGVCGLPVRLLTSGDVAALVSPWEGPPPDLTRPLLLAHARVVAAAHEAGACLPCPAGTVETEAALAAWLEQREPLLTAALARVERHHQALAAHAAAVAPGAARVDDERSCSYLIHRDREEVFVATARDRAGVDVRLTGPWPPYSFCSAID